MKGAVRLFVVSASALSGIVLGFLIAFWGPVLVGLLRGEDPIHQSAYSRWIDALSIALPIIFATILALLSWHGRWPIGLRIIRWLALVAAVLMQFNVIW